MDGSIDAGIWSSDVIARETEERLRSKDNKKNQEAVFRQPLDFFRKIENLRYLPGRFSPLRC
jgi:hypothetical protein